MQVYSRNVNTQTQAMVVNNNANSKSTSSMPSTTELQNNVNISLVQGILEHFQNLQIKLNLPTYGGEVRNPVEFVEKLEKYFILKRTHETQKLIITEEALKGRARAWFAARMNPFIDFNHFKTMFLREF